MPVMGARSAEIRMLWSMLPRNDAGNAVLSDALHWLEDIEENEREHVVSCLAEISQATYAGSTAGRKKA